MGRIILLPALSHRDLRLLMPWYATGRLSDVERLRVEAHLAICADCRAELQTDRRLHEAMSELPFDAEAGWIRLRGRIAAHGRPEPGWLNRTLRFARGAPPWVKWGLAGQAALVSAGALVLLTVASPARYETLGAPKEPTAGEIMVVFQPDMTERQLRSALNAADVRLVGGPTAAGAYLLRPGGAGRDTALAILRRRPEVVAVEPLDAATAPGGTR